MTMQINLNNYDCIYAQLNDEFRWGYVHEQESGNWLWCMMVPTWSIREDDGSLKMLFCPAIKEESSQNVSVIHVPQNRQHQLTQEVFDRIFPNHPACVHIHQTMVDEMAAGFTDI